MRFVLFMNLKSILTLGEKPKMAIRIIDIIKELEDIPPLPKTALDLLDLTNDIQANAGRATEILAQDPALSMKVLKAANSAKYGYARHIATVSQAVVILGFKGLRNLILGLAIYKFLNEKQSDFGTHLWRHLITTACLSKMITNKLGQEDPELGFLCGLIHDIGKAVLLNRRYDIYTDLINRAEAENIPMNELEENFLGFTHADLGRDICRAWLLPGILVKVISLHHNSMITTLDDEGHNELLKTVAVADNLSKIFNVDDDKSANLNMDVLNLYNKRGIDQKFLEECFSKLPEEMAKLEGIFPDIFPKEKHDLSIKVQLSDPLQEKTIRLFILGHGLSLTDSFTEADIHLTDNETKTDSPKSILCDFFTNDTHFSNKILFTNHLHEWLEKKKIIPQT
jgi:putative nucleotidyltransferase with HDIG domain